MTATNPADVSWMSTRSRSPPLMNRSEDACGVKVSSVASSGLGGACGVPESVTNAKFAGSIPTVFRQSELLGMALL
jgi:hypothetical protein